MRRLVTTVAAIPDLKLVRVFLVATTSVMVSFVIASGSAATQLLYGPDQMTNAAAWGANVGGTGDSAFTFNYDYSADGIPEAPHSRAEDIATRGVKLEANIVSPETEGEGFALFPLEQNFTGPHRLRFDAWMNYDADEANTPPGTRYGTTEFLGGGVGYDSLAPGIGSGVQSLAAGDGDAQGDWRAYNARTSRPAFLVTGEDMAAGTREGADPYYSDFLPFVDPPAVQGQTASGIAGSPGFQWITWEFTSVGGLVTVDIEKPTGDRLRIVEIDCNDTSDRSHGCTSEGNISLLYGDYVFTVTPRPDLTFGIIDNVVVTAVPEPTGLGTYLVSFLVIIMSRRCWICKWCIGE